jgi:hypothetical protein
MKGLAVKACFVLVRVPANQTVLVIDKDIVNKGLGSDAQYK